MDHLKPISPRFKTIVSLTFLILTMLAAPAAGTQLREAQKCISEQIKIADDAMTIGEIRKLCSEQPPITKKPKQHDHLKTESRIVEHRLEVDDTNILNPFTLMSHRHTYILGAHNFNGWDSTAYQEAYDDETILTDNTEVQFQLSIKTPLAVNLFNDRVDLFAA